ncbi:MAG: hypothetical protein ACKVS8_03800 [Phycisphaerales bacterium]
MADIASITQASPTTALSHALRGGGAFTAAAERARAGTGARQAQSLLGARQQLFSDVLAGAAGNRTGGNVAEQTPADPMARARTAAQDFVAIAFVGPVLKGLRDANNAAPPFAPGPAEKQFGALMDQQMARQVVRASHFPLVDRVARDLLRTGGTARSVPLAPVAPVVSVPSFTP